MEEDLIDFNLPEAENSIITVIGVGGGGSNAVNRMFQQGIRDVDFFVANTDAQSLAKSLVPVKVHLGETLTEGRGAGNKADIGKQAAVESAARIRECIKPGTKMAFIVAGMGGGTGTGAAPVIAGMCREFGILTVGIVTLPFRFEGPVRMKQAVAGIQALKNEVDSLLIIHNEKLREIYGNLTLSNAFANADNILMLAVKGIAEIITIHGYVNVDFADVFSIMSKGGIAFMGSASAGGQDRAKNVIQEAINSPLLNNNDIKGAKKVLLNITSGKEEITVDEVGSITDTIIEKVQARVNTIWGTCTDETLGDEIRITLIATGFGEDSVPELYTHHPPDKTVVELPDKRAESLFEELESSNPGKSKPVEKEGKTEDIKQDDADYNPESDLLFNVDTDQDSEPEINLVVGKTSEELNEPEFEEVTGFDADADKGGGKKDLFSGINGTDISKDQVNDEESLDTLEKINSARLKALNYNNYTQDNIEQIEREPAFKRKKDPVQSEIFPKEESESRYTIGSNDAKLRANNSFLYDPVD